VLISQSSDVLKFNYMRLVLYLLLLLIVINAVILDKALNILTPKELKRRARSGRDTRAANIYKMAAYSSTLSSLLWIKGSLAAALFFVLVLANSWVAAFIFLAALAWAVRSWKPSSTKSWVWAWASNVAPAIAWIMSYLQPVLRRLTPSGLPSLHIHTGVYEKEDLLELLQAQSRQPENRISESELMMAYNALIFGDKRVTDIMTPLRKLHLVSEDEQIGPHLMDELHATGFSRFPVAKAGTLKAAQPQIVGTLFLKDLVGYTGSGRAAGLMQTKVYYINESQGLRDALAAFLKTHHHLFIVVNNFEEIVGVLSVEDVLEQIVGAEIVDEFDKYDDLRAVAGLEAKKDHAQHEHVKATQPSPENSD
jgi:CBS domain containing-hemolysin-like protein